MRRNCGLAIAIIGVLAVAGESHAQSAAVMTGERVRIEGPVRSDGSLVAKRVSREDWRAPVVVRGPILALDGFGGRLFVLGVRIETTPLPNLDGVRSLAALRAGDVVEVEGLPGRGVVQATRLRLISRTATATASGAIEGPLEVLDADGFELLGSRVWSPAAAARLDDLAAVEGNDPIVGGLRRDAEDQQIQSVAGGRWVIVGGRLDASFVREENFDLEPDGGTPHDRTTSGLQVQSLVTLPGGVEGFAKIKGNHRVLARDDRGVGGTIEVSEAYVSWRIAGSPVSLHAGRQRFRDTRGWLLDDDLDAVRLDAAAGRWGFQAAVADGVFADAGSRRRADQRHLYLSGSVQLAGMTVTSRLLARHDRSRAERPVYVGVSSDGRLGRQISYWSNLAVLRGRSDSTTFRGWATDVGGTYQTRLRWKPAISIGYATGSGDQASRDSVDETFRPTGLESNSYRIAGLKWLGYYGELFDPDLSNLQIVTGAVSVRPLGALSIETVYHRYAQVILTRRLAGNDLDADGTGRSAHVGQELDVIVAFRRRPIDVSLISGFFRPGGAFDAASRPAMLIKPQVRVYF